MLDFVSVQTNFVLALKKMSKYVQFPMPLYLSTLRKVHNEKYVTWYLVDIFIIIIWIKEIDSETFPNTLYSVGSIGHTICQTHCYSTENLIILLFVSSFQFVVVIPVMCGFSENNAQILSALES